MVDTDDTRRTIHDGRRTTPRVWHKLPTGELTRAVAGFCDRAQKQCRPPAAIAEEGE